MKQYLVTSFGLCSILENPIPHQNGHRLDNQQPYKAPTAIHN